MRKFIGVIKILVFKGLRLAILGICFHVCQLRTFNLKEQSSRLLLVKQWPSVERARMIFSRW